MGQIIICFRQTLQKSLEAAKSVPLDRYIKLVVKFDGTEVVHSFKGVDKLQLVKEKLNTEMYSFCPMQKHFAFAVSIR